MAVAAAVALGMFNAPPSMNDITLNIRADHQLRLRGPRGGKGKFNKPSKALRNKKVENYPGWMLKQIYARNGHSKRKKPQGEQ